MEAATSDFGTRRRRSLFMHPARLIAFTFGAAVVIGTGLLTLPVATAGPGRADVSDALFTATSAVCVTGLAVVDTPSTWSTFGEVVILVLIQIGGIGIMSLATLLLMLLSGRIGLRTRLLAQTETGVLTPGEVTRVLRHILVLTVVVEAVATLLLAARLWASFDESFGRALWLGLFHAVSAFNNAGFALYPDNLVRFVGDPVVNLTVVTAVILGGLGAPVLAELVSDRLRWRRFSLHTKLVLTTSVVLVVGGTLAVAVFEWSNPGTLGQLTHPEKLLASVFQGVSPRTAGFNTIDYAAMRETTLLVTTTLMFIGAAPASTGGGIKVTTFALLGFVILSEVRGDRDVTLFGRRSPAGVQRQALAIALVGVGVVVGATLLVLANAGVELMPALFEVTSAFGTVGLTTGITPLLDTVTHSLLVVLMFVGRVGPLTLATALALRQRDVRFRLPEERPLIG